jgi:REP element-mobilizing transposase RayT
MPATLKSGQVGAISQRCVLAETARRISAPEEALLGATPVGEGYFCATVGAITQDQIKLYIEKHQSEPPDENFGIDGE